MKWEELTRTCILGGLVNMGVCGGCGGLEG